MTKNVQVRLLWFWFLQCLITNQDAVFAAHQPQKSTAVLVRYVIDGDTIDVVGVGRVRLLGIDAPELGRPPETPAPFAKQAQEKLASLVLNRWVRLEYDAQDRDSYRRRLAYVVLETGVFVNAAMIREGLARVSARSHLTRIAELTRAEAEARAWRRGMWRFTPTGTDERYAIPRGPRKRRGPAKN